MNDKGVALVTGSGRKRVGWHIADALAARGYALAIHYHTSAAEAAETVREMQQRGTQAVALAADLSDEQQVHALVDQTLAQFGRLDVLVACAATWRRKRLEELTAKDVLDDFRVNALGPFLCAQRAGLAMTGQTSGGSIVLVGDWATRRPYVDHAGYMLAKGAIPTLTRVMAVELGTRNPAVRVNCVLPGPVMLPPDLPAAEREAAIRATLVAREGRPENVVQAVLHFIDNDFVTGAALPVDGGRSIFTPDSRRSGPA